MLAVYLPDRVHARRYVSSGFDASGLAEVVELPESIRGNDWDYQIVDDLSVNPTDGMRAMVRRRLPVGAAAGRPPGRPGRRRACRSSARKPSGFKHDDVDRRRAESPSAWR